MGEQATFDIYARHDTPAFPLPGAGEANLTWVYAQAHELEVQAGKQWYTRAKDFAEYLANKYDIRLEQAAGIIAVLSPSQEWSDNKRAAEQIIKSRGRDTSGISTYPLNIRKASAILSGRWIEKQVRGPKVTAFYRAILGAEVSVTVDGHIVNAYCGRFSSVKAGRIRESQYQTIARAIESLAIQHGVTPCEMQAILWLTWKRLLRRSRG